MYRLAEKIRFIGSYYIQEVKYLLLLSFLAEKIFFVLRVGAHVQFAYAFQQTSLKHDTFYRRHFYSVLGINERTESLKIFF